MEFNHVSFPRSNSVSNLCDDVCMTLESDGQKAVPQAPLFCCPPRCGMKRPAAVPPPSRDDPRWAACRGCENLREIEIRVGRKWFACALCDYISPVNRLSHAKLHFWRIHVKGGKAMHRKRIYQFHGQEAPAFDEAGQDAHVSCLAKRDKTQFQTPEARGSGGDLRAPPLIKREEAPAEPLLDDSRSVEATCGLDGFAFVARLGGGGGIRFDAAKLSRSSSVSTELPVWSFFTHPLKHVKRYVKRSNHRGTPDSGAASPSVAPGKPDTRALADAETSAHFGLQDDEHFCSKQDLTTTMMMMYH